MRIRDEIEGNASEGGFAKILAASFEVLGTLQHDLAVEFEVAESTVSRWAKGTARPHPRIQKQVIRSLQRRAEKPVARPRTTESTGSEIEKCLKAGSVSPLPRKEA
ncbi:MAG TPA: hypothetical protein VNO30_06620 [Kofleriaceae bacterium]|nr:hypothetical protein [Kofleriaceae bacterium]